MNELIEKYFAGETSIQEETQLQEYMLSDHVHPDHEVYRALFRFRKSEQNIKSNRTMIFPQIRKSRPWVTAAAVAVMVIGLVGMPKLLAQPQELGTFDDPEVAYQETVRALQEISMIFNKTGEQLKHVQQFEVQTNKILKPTSNNK